MLLTLCLLFIGLHVSEGCTLKNKDKRQDITGSKGWSVLLPCSCTDLDTKPQRPNWMKFKTDRQTYEDIPFESDQSKKKFQLVNDHSPGNLSLLISHLTEEDGGEYRCEVKESGETDINLIVKVCTLENNKQSKTFRAHTGESVLLPCACTDLHTKPETFTWKKHNTIINKYEVISIDSGQYRNRVQLVNNSSPGNLSLLISHLTEEDGGDYRCYLPADKQTDIILTVKEGPPQPTTTTAVCTLENNKQSKTFRAHTGGSVLLPCSCTDLQTKPETFTWKKHNTIKNKYEEISRESGQYRNRVQLVNDHSPGNLSLLISHLTEEDGGAYRCYLTADKQTDIVLTVEEGPTQPTTTTNTNSILTPTMSPQPLPFVPFALVTVILLHIIVAVVYYTSRTKAKSDSARVQYSPADGDGVVNLE